MKIKTNIVKLLAVLAILGSLVAIAAVPALAVAPTATLGSASGFPGQGITISGSGWTAGAVITLSINGNPVTTAAAMYVGEGTGSAYPWNQGTFSGSFVVPAIPGGLYSSTSGLKVTDGALTQFYNFTVTPFIAVSPTGGPVGTAVTITGVGFAYPSSATAALAGGVQVTAPFPIPIASNGSLSATLTIPSTALPGGNNITVTDGSHNTGIAAFAVTPGITLLPATAMPGNTFSILGNHFTPGAIVGVLWDTITNIGNTTVSGTGTFTASVIVPTTALVGSHTVEVVNNGNANEYAAATMTLGSIGLTVTPSTGLAFSVISVQGAGFTPNAHLTSLTFNGESVTNLTATIDSSGTLTATCVAPALAGGTINVVAMDSSSVTRTTTWVIPAATLTLSPASGTVGTPFTVGGSNFIPGAAVTLTIAGIPLTTTTVNTNGQFSYSTIIPNGVAPGPNTVTAQDAVIAVVYNTAVATFTVPSGVITLSPSQGVPGQTITFTGTGFPAYSSITSVQFIRVVGGVADVTPAPKPVVGGDGTVTGTFTVPSSMVGLATVTISAGGTSGATTFTVQATGAAPANAFASLIANNQLTRVWSYNAANGVWSMYDPADVADSTITMLTDGTAYWIGVTANVTLTYGTYNIPLYTGWNNIGWQG
jgi:hypothetical protein